MGKSSKTTPDGVMADLKKRWKRAVSRKKRYSNEEYNKRYYKQNLGVEPDLKNPKTFGEKLVWMKLYYNNPLYSICADKYAVREFVKERGHADILNELIGVYDSPDEIPFSQLPDRFVIKANHGCGWNIICKDKNEFMKQLKGWKKVMRRWMKLDYSIYYRELHYGPIPPKIVIEKFLDGDDGHELKDYKFFCFDGEPEMIQINYHHPHTNVYEQSFHDKEWKQFDIQCFDMPVEKNPIPKPENLEEMLGIVRNLAAGFAHVRVDLYVSGGKIYFGEMTFSDGAGFAVYKPASFDLYLGSLFPLPDKSSPYVMLK